MRHERFCDNISVKKAGGEMNTMSDTKEEDSSPINMDNKSQPAGDHGEDDDDSGGARDGGARDKSLTNNNDQETATGDAKVDDDGDVRNDENHPRGSLTKDTVSNPRTAGEDEKRDDDDDDGGGGESFGDDNNVNNSGDSSIMDNVNQEDRELDGDNDSGKDNVNSNHSANSSQTKTDNINFSKLEGAGNNVGDNNKSKLPGDTSQSKMENPSEEGTKLDHAAEHAAEDSSHVNSEESSPSTNLLTTSHSENKEGGRDGSVADGSKGNTMFRQTNRNQPEKRLKTSKSLDSSTKESPRENKSETPLFASNDKVRKIGNILLSENSNTTISSPQSIQTGAVHALTEIAKATKHGSRESMIQNRQVMSVKTKQLPDRSAQKLLRDRRDRVIESLMRKDAQRNDAAYTYGKFSPIKTDKLPEFRATAARGAAPKKSPLHNLMNEPFDVATNKRTLERRRLRLSKEIAALDMLPEGNMIKPDELLKPVLKDATGGILTTARSSLIGKVRERKLRSETKKELQLRRRKMPRISDYNKLSFALSSTGYRPKRPVPKVLPKLGQSNKKGGHDSTNKPGEGEKNESNEQNQQHKGEGKHVSFGPICILNIDEEFAMFVQANRQPFKNAYRAQLRRQQATDNGFAGGKYGQLSPVRKQAKSTITDKSFSTEKKEVPQFTAKPVTTLPKIGQTKPENKPVESKNTEEQVPTTGDDENPPKKPPLTEKKPNKSILKIAKYNPPDMTLNVKCSPEFRAIMDSLHGVNPSPFLLK